MNQKTLTKEQIVRLCFFGSFQLFAIVSAILSFFVWKDWESGSICIVTMVFLLLPNSLEKLMHFKISLPVYIFAMLYGISHMLGHTYGFYYNVPHWDKVLHTTGGVAFALFGAYIPKLILKRDDCNVLICAFFGLCFSVLICVLWEFFEFGFDNIFGGDMQKDTWIDHIYSYELGKIMHGETGIIERLEGLGNIVVSQDGTVLFEGKYLDIGLVDSMIDMMVETLGAVIYAVAYILDKGG